MRWNAGRLRLAAATLAFGLTAGPQANAETPPPPPRAPAVVYAKTCGYCHGQHVAPVIRGRAIPTEMTTAIVRRGQRAMPAFRPTEISNAELGALAAWLKAAKADPKEHDQ
ncbi:cytochrome c [Novosphingobium sp.]|uniref:c-type cytochrome n=1 Tax=Novosphingobium sp. TaxID=1874826 RepID=UPI002608E5B1|nr:cytochrome c [Novosphingobium sp.]